MALESNARIHGETLGEHLRDGRPETPVGAGNPEGALPPAGFNLEHHLQQVERTHVERALKVIERRVIDGTAFLPSST